MATVTWVSYGKAWSEWLECVGALQVSSSRGCIYKLPWIFLLCLCSQGVTGVVAQHYISGLAFHFQLSAWENIAQQFLLFRTLQGWLKEHTHVERRKPVLFGLLQSLLSALPQVCSSFYESLLFYTTFGLAFFGAHPFF